MNIVFLDVDGVLNSLEFFKKAKTQNFQHKEIDLNTLPILQQIIKDNHAKIVLSSTWRVLEGSGAQVQGTYQELIDILKEYDIEIMSKTPVLSHRRPAEIKTWLNNQDNTTDICWISLDDDFNEEAYQKEGLGGHLVHTSFYGDKGGLQLEHIDMAKELFNKQLSNKGEK